MQPDNEEELVGKVDLHHGGCGAGPMLGPQGGGLSGHRQPALSRWREAHSLGFLFLRTLMPWDEFLPSTAGDLHSNLS